ncbi:MAG: CHRD domain-containing protein [Longimicrobiales bacterium]
MQRRIMGSMLAFTVAVTAGCVDDSASPGPLEPVVVPVFVHSAADAPHNLRTHLTGDEEVPPTGSRAQGQAVFQLSPDGSELSYKLIVANIENVLMAHIHVAPAGVNGPIVVWLYPEAPPPQLIPGRFQGVLEQGVITDDDVMNPLPADPLGGESVALLMDAIRAGNTYVNVHTTQFPGGEIRGQID